MDGAGGFCPLASLEGRRQPAGMESHEWNEMTDEGKRYFRATHHAGRWTILTTLKTDPDWVKVEDGEVPEEMWRALREVVWRKYQRKRCPWERVAELDKILGEEPSPESRG
jgi:hypothetical protein